MWTKSSFILQVISIDILFFRWYGTSRGVKEVKCFMTHFFCSFFLFLVRIRHTFCRVVSLISSPSEEEEEGKTGAPLKSVSHEKAASKSARHRCGRGLLVVLRRRKEWSSSSSKRERERQNHRFSFGRLFERELDSNGRRRADADPTKADPNGWW